jgi:flagellin-like protein
MLNKKAISPLVATIMLVVFALVIGTFTMIWSNQTVNTIPEERAEKVMVIKEGQLDNPLKNLQADYILDKINLDEYLTRQTDAISKTREQENNK